VKVDFSHSGHNATSAVRIAPRLL